MKILHLSDLHFGTEIPGIVDLLIDDCKHQQADFIVVSGDLTQRATDYQYQLVKNFLSNFDAKKILSVPGNHDISLHNPVERFFYPFARYKKWISPDLCSSYADNQVAILGINSVTPYKSMGGYITDEQLSLVEKYFAAQPQNLARVVVMHHNLIKSQRHKIINDADNIIRVFSEAKVNIVLSGHIHFACVEKIKKEYVNHNMYIITAGTPVSWRTTAPNSYNVIDIHEHEFIFSVRQFTGSNFLEVENNNFPL